MTSNFVPRAFLCLALGGGQALGTRLYDLATRSLPQMKDYPSLSIGLNEVLSSILITLSQDLWYEKEKKKVKAAPGQDLNPKHPRNCFYPRNR